MTDNYRDKIVIVALGGTIAMVPGNTPGAVPRLSAEDLAAAVPALAEYPIEPVSFLQKPGAHLTFEDLDALAGRIREICTQGAAGVIVTQGTDTIEEVSFFLDLALDVEQPVIVTGAMRNPSLAGADGPANLLAAVQVARSEQARKLGVLVVFNDEIHAARFVAKQHTTSVAAFVSPNAGKIGWVSEGRVIVTTLPKTMGTISPVAVPRAVNVPIIPVALDLDPAIIGAVAGLNIDGLVVEAVGGGHCAPRVADELKAIAVKMPVILSSRTGGGQVLCSTYGFSGGEIDLLRAGLIDSGWLDGRKSRILLSSALRSGMSRTDAIAMFDNFRS